MMKVKHSAWQLKTLSGGYYFWDCEINMERLIDLKQDMFIKLYVVTSMFLSRTVDFHLLYYLLRQKSEMDIMILGIIQEAVNTKEFNRKKGTCFRNHWVEVENAGRLIFL